MAAAAEEWSLMRHHTVTVGVELKQYGEQKVVEVSLKDDVIERFSLGLVLLREQVVDTLSLVGKSTRLDIRVADEQHVDLPADKYEPRIARCWLSPEPLSSLLHFSLRYYATRVIQVDHVDLEMSDGREDYYLTFALCGTRGT